MPQRGGTSKKRFSVKRLVMLVGAPDEIAPIDEAAFGKKGGELIARAASARRRAKAAV